MPRDPIGAHLWSPTDADLVGQIFSRLVGSLTDGGWKLSDAFEIDLAALNSLLRFPPWAVATQGVILEACRNLRAGGHKDLADIDRELRMRLQSQHRERLAANQSNWLVMPVKLPYSLRGEVPSATRVLGMTFCFMRIETLPGYLGTLSRPVTDVVGRSSTPPPQTAICVEALGSTPIEAVQEAWPAFCALRGAIELLLSYRTRTISFGGRVRLGKVPNPSVVHCLRLGGGTDSLYLDEPDWDVPDSIDEPRDAERLTAKVKSFLEPLQDAPDPQQVESLLADALRLYAQALQEDFRHNRLLALWQMAELMTLDPQDRGKGDSVIARLALLEDHIRDWPKGGVAPALRGIMHKRNDLVHRGLHGTITDDDVGLLKRVCEETLLWLFRNRGALKTRSHLAHWWQLAPKHQKHISSLVDVLEALRTARGF